MKRFYIKLGQEACDVYPGLQKWHGMFCQGCQKLHGMFCPGWQIDVGCFVRGCQQWHGMFCPWILSYTF